MGEKNVGEAKMPEEETEKVKVEKKAETYWSRMNLPKTMYIKADEGRAILEMFASGHTYAQIARYTLRQHDSITKFLKENTKAVRHTALDSARQEVLNAKDIMLQLSWTAEHGENPEIRLKALMKLADIAGLQETRFRVTTDVASKTKQEIEMEFAKIMAGGLKSDADNS